MKNIMVVLGHSYFPNAKVNKFLLEQIQDLPIQVTNLWELYPDFKIDVAEEQKKVEQADLIIFQNPVNWWSLPAITLKWIADVVSYGWAYGTPEARALKGKDLTFCLTTGSPRNFYERDDLMKNLASQWSHIGQYCQMNTHSPYVCYQALLKDMEKIEDFANQYKNMIKTYLETGNYQAQNPQPL